MGCVAVSTAIEKSLFLLRMSMQIQNHANLPLLVCIQDLVLYEVDLRVELLGWILPSPIQISADE